MFPKKRTHQRYEIALPVVVLYQGQTFDGTSRNISIGGMFVGCTADIPFGVSLDLTFEIATLDRPIVAKAVVRWVEANQGVGVVFHGLRAQEVWSLQRLFSAQVAPD